MIQGKEIMCWYKEWRTGPPRMCSLVRWCGEKEGGSGRDKVQKKWCEKEEESRERKNIKGNKTKAAGGAYCQTSVEMVAGQNDKFGRRKGWVKMVTVVSLWRQDWGERGKDLNSKAFPALCRQPCTRRSQCPAETPPPPNRRMAGCAASACLLKTVCASLATETALGHQHSFLGSIHRTHIRPPSTTEADHSRANRTCYRML